jgi:ParB/RepB/Spo0J family partition protein
VRKSGRYELIVGERRLRAIRDYTKMKTIQAQVVHVRDLQARWMSAAENMQREKLSAIEAIEAIVKIVDAKLIEDKEYATMDKTPEDRVKILLR